MKINGERLKALMAETGATTEQVAAALVERGMNERDAASALNNWIAGRNYPRCKPSHVARIARALQRRPAEFCRYVSTARFVRGSDRKVGLVAAMIRGMQVDRAMSTLQFSDKRAAVSVKNTLMAAIADAERAEADVASLVVAESRVGGGPIIKRFRPKDRGRAHPIKKRTSNIVIGVEERE